MTKSTKIVAFGLVLIICFSTFVYPRAAKTEAHGRGSIVSGDRISYNYDKENIAKELASLVKAKQEQEKKDLKKKKKHAKLRGKSLAKGFIHRKTYKKPITLPAPVVTPTPIIPPAPVVTPKPVPVVVTPKTTPPATTTSTTSSYPIHKQISTTYFWAGEEAGPENGNISNLPSAWDEHWVTHFGGVDDPNNRNGYNPAGFTPKENPFYFALPYNDFGSNGRKADASSIIPWAKSKTYASNESMCKNRWIKITKNGKTAYAQWEDVGPYGEDDSNYVFGNAQPQNSGNNNAGLDVSPAVRDYLGLSGMDKTDWQFVDASQVPAGPWKNIITTSQTSW